MDYSSQPVYEQQNAKAEKLIVFLHGYGSDGNDLIGLAPFFSRLLPETYFFSPHGLEPSAILPIGRQWFSLEDRDPKKIFELGINAAEKLCILIKKKQEELKLDNSRTTLVGFSQGTMVALLLNLTTNDPFEKLVGFSGRLFMPREIKNYVTPIALIHGLDDAIVGHEETIKAEALLQEKGVICRKLLIPNLAHSIDMTGIEFAINFIKE